MGWDQGWAGLGSGLGWDWDTAEMGQGHSWHVTRTGLGWDQGWDTAGMGSGQGWEGIRTQPRRHKPTYATFWSEYSTIK